MRLNETGADGFVPASSIGHEYFYHDEKRQALIGEETGAAFQLGDTVEVRLVEAIPIRRGAAFRALERGPQDRRRTRPRRASRATAEAASSEARRGAAAARAKHERGQRPRTAIRFGRIAELR